MQESVLLSESLIKNEEEANMRDPFVAAKMKFDSMNETMPKPEVLSSSKIEAPPMIVDAGSPAAYTSFKDTGLPKMLQKLGISDKGIPLSEVGKMQMLGRAKQKFGEGFMTNPQLLEVIKAFDDSLKKGQQDMTASLSGADRTLKAILGG